MDITAISKSISALQDRRSRYQKEIESIDAEIAQKREAFSQLNKLLEQFKCPICNGTGERSFTDAAGSRDTEQCKKCHGTGVKLDTKD